MSSFISFALSDFWTYKLNRNQAEADAFIGDALLSLFVRQKMRQLSPHAAAGVWTPQTALYVANRSLQHFLRIKLGDKDIPNNAHDAGTLFEAVLFQTHSRDPDSALALVDELIKVIDTSLPVLSERVRQQAIGAQSVEELQEELVLALDQVDRQRADDEAKARAQRARELEELMRSEDARNRQASVNVEQTVVSHRELKEPVHGPAVAMAPAVVASRRRIINPIIPTDRTAEAEEQLTLLAEAAPVHAGELVVVSWKSRRRISYHELFFSCCGQAWDSWGYNYQADLCGRTLWKNRNTFHSAMLRGSGSRRAGGGLHPRGRSDDHLPKCGRANWSCCYRSAEEEGCVPLR